MRSKVKAVAKRPLGMTMRTVGMAAWRISWKRNFLCIARRLLEMIWTPIALRVAWMKNVIQTVKFIQSNAITPTLFLRHSALS